MSIKFLKPTVPGSCIPQGKAYPVKSQMTKHVFAILDDDSDNMNVSIKPVDYNKVAGIDHHYGWVPCDENGKEVEGNADH